MVKGKPNLVCLTINQLGDSSGIISDIYCCGQVGESKMCWKLKDECQIARHQAKRELLVPEKLSGLNQYVFISASASDEHVYAEPFVPVELVAPLLPKLEGEQRDVGGFENLFRLLLADVPTDSAGDLSSPESTASSGRVGLESPESGRTKSTRVDKRIIIR